MFLQKNKDFPLDHYSASAFGKFSTNPFMFKINNVNKEYFNVASSVSGILGSAVHRAMQMFFGGVPDITVVNIKSEALKQAYEYGLQFLQDYNEAFINYNSDIKTKEDLIEKYSFCFFGLITEGGYGDFPIENILLVEKMLKHSVEIEGKKLPVPLVGKPDLVWRNNQGQVIIDDYKTCKTFSKEDKIDGHKLIQAIFYYILVWAELGEKPHAVRFMEYKHTKNRDKTEKQLQPYVMVYEDISIAFELFYRFYEDITDALLGKQVFVPNFNDLFDNEIAIISYIHRLDQTETRDKLFKKEKVDNISDFISKKIQKSGKMKKYLEVVSKQFISGESLNYKDMQIHDKIKMKLAEHGVALDFISKIEGSTVTLYCYEPSIGLKMTRIEAFVKDIEQVVEKTGVRILAPIPNTGLIGFEVPNTDRTFPVLPDIMDPFQFAIGETIMGEIRRFDIRTAPHMLVAGSTGSGKSVFLHNLINQLLETPNTKLYLYDPKQVELSMFEGNESVEVYEHDSKRIILSLKSLVKEMERRYTILKENKLRSLSQDESLFPYIFAIIDEYADLSMSDAVGSIIQKLAQKGRACGIHLVIATQRASTKVISGDIKINFPTKIVFKMAKEVDSRVMLDQAGAEKLLGKGDCLFMSDSGLERLQAYTN